jgi:hypothetical protein
MKENVQYSMLHFKESINKQKKHLISWNLEFLFLEFDLVWNF